MSTVENGLPIKKDPKTVNQKLMKDKVHNNPSKDAIDLNSGKYKDGQSKSVVDSKSYESHTLSMDPDQDNDTSDFSPDISQSSQKTLKFSDAEPELTEHNTSHESSDSIETLEEHPKEDPHVDVNHSFFQHLSLVHNDSENSVDSIDKLRPRHKSHGSSYSDDSASGDSHEVIPDVNNASRPESLSLPQSHQASEEDHSRTKWGLEDTNNSSNGEDSQAANQKTNSYLSQLVALEDQGAYFIEPSGNTVSQSLPHGTITRKGDLIQFVADDLQEKIKQSSPMSHADGGSSGSRRSSVRSIASVSSSTSFATSSGLSRSPSSLFQQSPDDIPPIDASAVIELENHACKVADSLDLMMGNIRNNLHKMSAITIGCEEAYKRSVDITCDSVDGSIKSMYALMAKCEELSAAMGPVDQLATQIREIKRVLDLFEAQVGDK